MEFRLRADLSAPGHFIPRRRGSMQCKTNSIRIFLYLSDIRQQFCGLQLNNTHTPPQTRLTSANGSVIIVMPPVPPGVVARRLTHLSHARHCELNAWPSKTLMRTALLNVSGRDRKNAKRTIFEFSSMFRISTDNFVCCN